MSDGIDISQIAVNALTLRDYFAAQAMAGWLASYDANQAFGDVDAEANARLVYRLADAMLAERGK